MKSRVIYLLCLFLVFEIHVKCQQVKLFGKVTVFNSKYNTGTLIPIEGAFIEANGAKPVTSDRNGNFKLEFVGIAPGESVELEVFKVGYQVVNSEILKKVSIGGKDTIGIYVAQPGKVDQFKIELAQISLDYLKKAYKEKNDRLHLSNYASKEVERNLEQLLEREIKKQDLAKEILNGEIEKLAPQLYLLIEAVSKVNLDFASEVYLQAISQLKSGNPVEAIRTLEEANLDKEADESIQAIRSNQRGVKEIEQAISQKKRQLSKLIDSMILKSVMHFLLFDFPKAKHCVRLMIPYSKFLAGERSLNVAQKFSDMKFFHFSMGEFDSALTYVDSAISIFREQLPKYNELIGKAYDDKSEILIGLDQPELAKEWCKMALSVKKKIFEPGHREISRCQNNLAIAYINLGLVDSALVIQKRCLNSLLENPKTKPLDLAAVYGNLADIFFRQGNIQGAIDSYQEDISLSESDSSTYDGKIGLSTAYDNLGQVYKEIGEYDSAMKHLFNSLRIRVDLFGRKHKLVVISKNNIGAAYFATNRTDSSIVWFKNAIENAEEIGISEPSLASIKLNLTLSLTAKEDYQEALKLSKESIALLEKYDNDHQVKLSHAYTTMGQLYYDIGLNDSAEYAISKGIRILEQLGNAEYPSLVEPYSNLGLAQQAMGKTDLAEASLLKSIQLFEEKNIGNPETRLNILFNLATFYYSSSNMERLIPTLHNLIESLPENMDEISGGPIIMMQIFALLEECQEIDSSLSLRQKNRYLFSVDNNTSLHDSIINEARMLMLISQKGITDSILGNQKKLILISDSLLPDEDTIKAVIFSNLSLNFYRIGNLDSAKKYGLLAASNSEGANHSSIIIRNFNLAWVFHGLNDLDSAIYFSRVGLEVSKLDSPIYHKYGNDLKKQLAGLLVERSKKYIDVGRDTAALNDLLSSVTYSPEDDYGWFRLSEFYFAKGNYTKAIAISKEANAAGHLSDSAFHNNISLYLIKNGQLEEAKKFILKQEKSWKTNAYPLKSWALYFAAKGRLRKSENYLIKSIENGYQGWSFISNEELFSDLKNRKKIMDCLQKHRPQ